MGLLRLVVAKLAWSSFDWKGLPSASELVGGDVVRLYERDVVNATMGYVRDYGVGIEWWNFDDEFCSHFRLDNCKGDFYYGSVPRGKNGIQRKLRDLLLDRGEELLVFFISMDYRDYSMKLIGVYCCAEYTGELEAPIDSSYKGALLSNLIDKANVGGSVKANFKDYFNNVSPVFRAPREYSMVFPENARRRVNQRKVFGVVLGQFLDAIDVTETANYDALIDLLNDVKGDLDESSAGKLDYILWKISEIKKEVEKGRKEERERIARGEFKEETIVYPNLTSSKDCVDALAEIAEILGYIPEKEYSKGTYRVDLVWKKIREGEPFLIFEVMFWRGG